MTSLEQMVMMYMMMPDKKMSNSEYTALMCGNIDRGTYKPHPAVKALSTDEKTLIYETLPDMEGLDEDNFFIESLGIGYLRKDYDPSVFDEFYKFLETARKEYHKVLKMMVIEDVDVADGLYHITYDHFEGYRFDDLDIDTNRRRTYEAMFKDGQSILMHRHGVIRSMMQFYPEIKVLRDDIQKALGRRDFKKRMCSCDVGYYVVHDKKMFLIGTKWSN